MCHNHFGSVSSFDRHMVRGRCIPTREFHEPVNPESDRPRLVATSNKYGTVWVERTRKATP